MPLSSAAPPELPLPRLTRLVSEALRAGKAGHAGACLLMRVLVTWLTGGGWLLWISVKMLVVGVAESLSAHCSTGLAGFGTEQDRMTQV